MSRESPTGPYFDRRRSAALHFVQAAQASAGYLRAARGARLARPRGVVLAASSRESAAAGESNATRSRNRNSTDITCVTPNRRTRSNVTYVAASNQPALHTAGYRRPRGGGARAARDRHPCAPVSQVSAPRVTSCWSCSCSDGGPQFEMSEREMSGARLYVLDSSPRKTSRRPPHSAQRRAALCLQLAS